MSKIVSVKAWRLLWRTAVFALCVAAYLISTVPVGLFLYSLKADTGVNIFERGGFHQYMRCLGKSFP